MATMEKLFEQYWKFVKYKIDKAVFDEHIREDLFQEVWLRVFKNEDKFLSMSMEKARNYINVMTRNLLYDYFKSVSKKGYREENIDDYLEILYQGNVVEREIFKNILSENIEKVLNKLDEKDKALVYWKFIEGHSDGEISEMMECSKDAVRMRTFRLKKTLRNLLNGTGGVNHEGK